MAFNVIQKSSVIWAELHSRSSAESNVQSVKPRGCLKVLNDTKLVIDE